MARHFSFRNLVANETYKRFLAAVHARSLGRQAPMWKLEDDWGPPGASQPPGQARPESLIESWLAGKFSKPPG